MRKCVCLGVVVFVMAAAPVSAQDKKFTIKAATTEPPKDLDASIRKLLDNKSVQFFDPAGTLICELWFRKELPSDATKEQVKNGLTYRELKETSVVGAVRFEQPWTDYRKQKVKIGVYTMRLGFQPPDGDHQGKSTYTEFLLLSSAAKDTSADTMMPKMLVDMSMKSIDAGHPAVFMLFPNNKAAAMPSLVEMEKNHVVLRTAVNVQAEGVKGQIGFGLTLVGEADE
jgi:hypothetical protein